eukprot:scaffold2525_cov216-Amphora_coffeaeformis.AAC.2
MLPRPTPGYLRPSPPSSPCLHPITFAVPFSSLASMFVTTFPPSSVGIHHQAGHLPRTPSTAPPLVIPSPPAAGTVSSPVPLPSPRPVPPRP